MGEKGKTATTKSDAANTEPTTPTSALNSANDVVGIGMDAAQIGTNALGKVAAGAVASADGLDDIGRALSATKTAEGAGKVFDGSGKASGVLDAGMAINDAYNTVNDPKATSAEKAGAVTKAAVKTALIFIRASPVVGLAMGVLDLTGVTDRLFKW